MSIMIATFVIPILAARQENARLGLKLVRKRFYVFMVAYVITILYIWPRL
jgi:hypothetical protein